MIHEVLAVGACSAIALSWDEETRQAIVIDRARGRTHPRSPEEAQPESQIHPQHPRHFDHVGNCYELKEATGRHMAA